MTLEDPRAFAHALQSNGPSVPDHARIFAPFIGSWDLVVRWFDESGALVRTEAGEWHFSWVLEGRGIQDVWIVPPRDNRGPGTVYEYGTSIRFHDPVLDAWRSVWIGPVQRAIRTFTARKLGPCVVLETTPDISPALRWSFHDIAADAFSWKNETRDAGGWRTQQTFEARRRVP
jgi:hypothetical protein